MTQPFFPCAISAQSRNNEFLTIKTVVRKTHQNNGHTGSSCLNKAVLAQGGGGTTILHCLHPNSVPVTRDTQVHEAHDTVSSPPPPSLRQNYGFG